MFRTGREPVHTAAASAVKSPRSWPSMHNARDQPITRGSPVKAILKRTPPALRVIATPAYSAARSQRGAPCASAAPTTARAPCQPRPAPHDTVLPCPHLRQDGPRQRCRQVARQQEGSARGSHLHDIGSEWSKASTGEWHGVRTLRGARPCITSGLQPCVHLATAPITTFTRHASHFTACARTPHPTRDALMQERHSLFIFPQAPPHNVGPVLPPLGLRSPPTCATSRPPSSAHTSAPCVPMEDASAARTASRRSWRGPGERDEGKYD